MNYYQSPAAVIDLPEADRVTFIRRTYAHLAGALAVFALLCTVIINSPLGTAMLGMLGNGKWSWLIVLGAFMVVSMVAQRWANSATSKGTQYFGLGLYVVAEALIFTPLLMLAVRIDSGIIPKAALITTGLFLGLTWIAFTTKKDFSFMGGIVRVGCFVAIGAIIASIVFGFSLGIIFSCLMVALMGGAVLYDTSNVIHHYQTNQYVAASLALFASFATMLWYVIRILISLSSND
jgi:FtsH-binding integral membrane protein